MQHPLQSALQKGGKLSDGGLLLKPHPVSDAYKPCDPFPIHSSISIPSSKWRITFRDVYTIGMGLQKIRTSLLHRSYVCRGRKVQKCHQRPEQHRNWQTFHCWTGRSLCDSSLPDLSLGHFHEVIVVFDRYRRQSQAGPAAGCRGDRLQTTTPESGEFEGESTRYFCLTLFRIVPYRVREPQSLPSKQNTVLLFFICI